jgi:hypothetical protein
MIAALCMTQSGTYEAMSIRCFRDEDLGFIMRR